MMLRTRREVRGHLTGWPVLVVGALLLSVGCGVHYWQRPGADVQDFQEDSQGYVTDVKVPRFSIEPEQIFRACMRARGWQRVQAGVPERNQFRGPEDVADFDNPPAPTTGHGGAHRDTSTDIACRPPTASRPPGVIGRPR